MGWTPVNSLTVTRDTTRREILVAWVDDVTGPDKEVFTYEQEPEALAFAAKMFRQRAM